ncbi:MAG: AraC family transcriptional regulator [Prevotella sp.]|jgi:AraC family transcriptional regulator
MSETTFYIKNMVCDRCKMAVEKTLRDEGLTPLAVDLGVVRIDGTVNEEQRERLRKQLEHLGFELLDDRRRQTIEQIKATIIKLVHYKDNNTSLNLSDFLQQELHQDYSSLSKLFSEYTSKTVECYYIEQRIERVKELLTYNEMSLTEIALLMNYSSVAYLSNQFKAVTGMRPSKFKTLQKNVRKGLDTI